MRVAGPSPIRFGQFLPPSILSTSSHVMPSALLWAASQASVRPEMLGPPDGPTVNCRS